MSSREVDIDALFARDADSRLLDRRRHEELGLPDLPPPASVVAPRFGAESIVEDEQGATPLRASLRAALDARPSTGLIPGAVVTVTVALYDDGDDDVPEALLQVALPAEAEPIPGSFLRDGLPVDGDALAGTGLRVGAVPAAGTVEVEFRLRVLPGNEPLELNVYAHAAGIPAIAPPALRLERRPGHSAAAAPPRPFYELEPGEPDPDDEDFTPHIGAQTPAQPVPPPQPEPRIDVAAGERVLPPIAPAPAPVERAPEPVAAAPPEPLVTAAAAQLLLRAWDPDEGAALERLFAGAMPHGLAALALLSSVAAVDGPLGEALGLSRFARGVAGALPRALVAARMGRPVPPVVTADALGAIDARAAARSAAVLPAGIVLTARLDESELERLRGVLARTLDDPFLRGVQLLLATAPRSVEGVGTEAGARVTEALAGYRVSAGAWLMRVTVRRAVDARFDPLTADDAPLHTAGRALVAALRRAAE